MPFFCQISVRFRQGFTAKSASLGATFWKNRASNLQDARNKPVSRHVRKWQVRETSALQEEKPPPPGNDGTLGLATLRGWRPFGDGGSVRVVAPPRRWWRPGDWRHSGDGGTLGIGGTLGMMAPWDDRALGQRAAQKGGCAMHDRLFDHFPIPRLNWYFTAFSQLTAGVQKGGCAAFRFERRTLKERRTLGKQRMLEKRHSLEKWHTLEEWCTTSTWPTRAVVRPFTSSDARWRALPCAWAGRDAKSDAARS